VTYCWSDEIFAEILIHLFRGRLESVEEMARMNALSTISFQFSRIVKDSVMPSIRYITHKIIQKTGPLIFLYFPNVDELEVPDSSSKTYTHLDQYNINLPSLRKLTFTSGFTPACFLLWKFTRLEDLTLRGNPFSDEALCSMTRLKRLDLSKHDDFRCGDKALSTLVSLEELHLPSRSNMGDSTLLLLTSLRKLSISHCPNITSLPSQLRSLSVRDSDTITGNCLTQLVALKSLKLKNCGKVRNKHIRKMTGLTSLHINRNLELTNVSFANLIGLKTLCYETRSYFFHAYKNGGECFKKLTALERLDVRGVDNGKILPGLSRLKSLRFLRLPTDKDCVDADFVKERPQLTTLIVPIKNRVTGRAREIIKERRGLVARIDEFVRKM